uniref:F-box domain-containing protein n=1 Tax=Oryza punctata TaxID=4537 RepID=A0A0E0LWB5_ORYPU
MEEQETSIRDLPTDAFVEILRRIAPSARRRLRFVCRRWRNVINSRAPAWRGQVKTLVYSYHHRPDPATAAYVIDDLGEEEACHRKLWDTAADIPKLPAIYSRLRMISSCNGLLCLYDEGVTGDIALLNPVTGETLDVAGPPVHRLRRQEPYSHIPCSEAFSFTYHQATERYKIVHLAVSYGWLEAVEVLTLGGGEEDDGASSSWRRVEAPAGSRCWLPFGVVSDDQATYWMSDGGGDRLMSFDLTDERVVPITSLPAAANNLNAGCLRKEMWLLERNGRQSLERWYCRFYLTTRRCMEVQQVVGPHFTQGEHILAHHYGSLYVHRCVSSAMRPQCSVAQMHEHWPYHEPMFTCGHQSDIRAFSYIETTEPLSVYQCNKTTFLGQMLTSIFNDLSSPHPQRPVARRRKRRTIRFK